MSLLNKSFVFLFCLLCGCSKHVVTTNGTIDKKIQDKIISEYNALPDLLKSECKSVVLCDSDRFEYSEQEIVDGSYTKNSITLLVDSRTKSIKDYKSVMIHEIVSIPLSEVHAIRYRSPHNPLKKSIFF